MAYSIDYINQICIDLGGTGGHKYNIDALNEICGLLGATAGHDYEIHALNAICTAMGYTAGWRYEIEALNAICTGGGGTGGHQYEIHAWQEIQTGSLLNLSAEYKSILSAMVGLKPNAATQRIHDNFIRYIKGNNQYSRNVWDKLVYLIPYCAGFNDKRDALIWWTDPTKKAEFSSTEPNYLSGKGFSGKKPIVAYINTKFNPTLFTEKIQKGNISHGYYYTSNLNNCSSSNGAIDSAALTGTYFSPRYQSKATIMIQSTVNNTVNTPSNSIHDLYVLNRVTDSQYDVYKRNNKYITSNTNASDLLNAELYSLATNKLGTGTIDLSFSTECLGIEFHGSGLDSIDVDIMVKAIDYLYWSINNIKYAFEKPSFKGSGICLTFDDIARTNSWITANNTLSSYGWKASFAINGTQSQIGDSQNNIQILAEYGHEMMNHSINHIDWATYLQTHTAQQLYDSEIQPVQDYFMNIFGYKPSTFAYFQVVGENVDFTNYVLSHDVFTRVRPYINTENLISASNQSKSIFAPDLYNLYFLYNGNNNYQELYNAIDRAYAQNKILIVLAHTIGTNALPHEIPLTVMQTICQKINDLGMKYYRIKDLPVLGE